MFNFKSALEVAKEIIERQKQSLAVKAIIEAEKEKLQEAVKGLHAKVSRMEKTLADEQTQSSASLKHWMHSYQNVAARLEEVEKFFRWDTTASALRDEYEQKQRQEAQRKVAEQKRQIEDQARQQEEERARQAQGQERQKALAVERQREEQEARKARELEWKPRGMGMGL